MPTIAKGTPSKGGVFYAAIKLSTKPAPPLGFAFFLECQLRKTPGIYAGNELTNIFKIVSEMFRIMEGGFYICETKPQNLPA